MQKNFGQSARQKLSWRLQNAQIQKYIVFPWCWKLEGFPQAIWLHAVVCYTNLCPCYAVGKCLPLSLWHRLWLFYKSKVDLSCRKPLLCLTCSPSLSRGTSRNPLEAPHTQPALTASPWPPAEVSSFGCFCFPEQGLRNATFSQIIPCAPARSQMLHVQEGRQTIYMGGMMIWTCFL